MESRELEWWVCEKETSFKCINGNDEEDEFLKVEMVKLPQFVGWSTFANFSVIMVEMP